MKKSLKRFTAGWLSALLCLLLSACGAPQSSQYRYADTCMGTLVQQSLYASDRTAADETAADIMKLLRKLEQQNISWRLETSEIYAVNQTAGSVDGYVLSRDMTDVINECVNMWEKSEGAFDVTIGSVARLWNIDAWAAEGYSEGFVPPDPGALQRELNLCGSGKLRLKPEVLDEEGEMLQARVFLPRGMQLDLGAVGKGLALDRIMDSLAESGVDGAVISVGGSVLTYGAKPNGGEWKIGVVNPRDPSENIGILSLTGQWCVSTSGDYERYVEADGRRYHHILDPATGCPADSGVRSVTILTRDGLSGDALSTACFVLGADRGMKLASDCGAEALFVTNEGEILMTERMKRFFQASRK